MSGVANCAYVNLMLREIDDEYKKGRRDDIYVSIPYPAPLWLVLDEFERIINLKYTDVKISDTSNCDDGVACSPIFFPLMSDPK